MYKISGFFFLIDKTQKRNYSGCYAPTTLKNSSGQANNSHKNRSFLTKTRWREREGCYFRAFDFEGERNTLGWDNIIHERRNTDTYKYVVHIQYG